MLKPKSLLKNTLFLLIIFLWITPSYAQNNGSKSGQSFGVSEGYERLYFDGAYHLRSIATDEIISFYEYNFVSNVENGHVVFKSTSGYYGILNEYFNSVLEPEWVEIKDFGFGYFALAHYAGRTTTEDRGSGLKEYPTLSWRIFSINEDSFISEMELLNPICIYGEVLAETLEKRKIKIALGKINFGYTDPVMKALVYVDEAIKQEPSNSFEPTTPKTK